MSLRTALALLTVVLLVATGLSISSIGPARADPVATPSTLPALPCPSGNATNGTVTAQLLWNSSNGWVGPAPVNLSVGIQVSGPVGPYNYSLSEVAIGTTLTGTVTLLSNGTGVGYVTEDFAVPANYTLNLTVVSSCAPYQTADWGGTVPVYGPAGPDPLHISGGRSSRYVTGNASYNATVLGRPAGTTIAWALSYPGQTSYGWITNQTTVNVTPLAPGSVSGQVFVWYPNGLMYASADLPVFSFGPVVNVTWASTPVANGSPTHATFWANVTPVTGAPSVPGAGIVWSTPYLPQGVTVTGSLLGSPATLSFFYNTSSPEITWVELSAVDQAAAPSQGNGSPSEFDLGSQLGSFSITNTTGGPPSPQLELWVINSSEVVSHGNLSFQLGAQVQSGPANTTYTLDVFALLASGGSGNWTGWNITVANWTGGPTLLSGSVPVANYTLYGNAFFGANVVRANVSLTPPSGSNSSTRLDLSATTTALSSTNRTAWLNLSVAAVSPNRTVGYGGPYLLNVTVWRNGSTYVWSAQPANWSGSWLNLSVGVPFGNYTVVGLLYSGSYPPLQLTLLDTERVTLCAPSCANPGGGGPLSLSLAAAPINGSAPLNISVDIAASGGVAPYNVSVCVRGPSTTTSVTGTCGSATTLNGWNGSSYEIPETLTSIGYYAINATVTDSNGSAAWAASVVNVTAAGAVPVLQAQVSLIAPPGGTGGTYSFVTRVSGGVAPYDIQWSFGDGTSGSALPGSTVTHVYTAAGTYEPSLTVTDARGAVATTHVGPFTVILPSAGTRGSALTSYDQALLAGGAVIVVASLVALGLVARWAAQRREALNWLNDLENGRGPAAPPPKP